MKLEQIKKIWEKRQEEGYIEIPPIRNIVSREWQDPLTMTSVSDIDAKKYSAKEKIRQAFEQRNEEIKNKNKEFEWDSLKCYAEGLWNGYKRGLREGVTQTELEASKRIPTYDPLVQGEEEAKKEGAKAQDHITSHIRRTSDPEHNPVPLDRR